MQPLREPPKQAPKQIEHKPDPVIPNDKVATCFGCDHLALLVSSDPCDKCNASNWLHSKHGKKEPTQATKQGLWGVAIYGDMCPKCGGQMFFFGKNSDRKACRKCRKITPLQ